MRKDIPFQREAGSGEDDAIGDWTPVRRLVPSSVALSSFDFKKPRPVNVDVPTTNEQGDVLRIETYEYTGAYGFEDKDAGEALSRIRMEEIESSGKFFQAHGNDRSAQPGRCFDLTGHFDEMDAADANFLIIDAHHTANNNYQDGDSAPSHYEVA